MPPAVYMPGKARSLSLAWTKGGGAAARRGGAAAARCSIGGRRAYSMTIFTGSRGGACKRRIRPVAWPVWRRIAGEQVINLIARKVGDAA